MLKAKKLKQNKAGEEAKPQKEKLQKAGIRVSTGLKAGDWDLPMW